MAERTTIARPYSQAVFDLTAETNTYEQWSVALQVLAMTAENKDVLTLIKNSAISTQDIVNLFVEVGGTSLHQGARNFISVLAAAKRLAFLPEIAALYDRMRQEAEKIIDVDFISSAVLDSTQQEAFQRILEKYLSKKVKMHYSVDASLLGGFWARAGNDVMDGSLRGRLIELKEAMGE